MPSHVLLIGSIASAGSSCFYSHIPNRHEVAAGLPVNITCRCRSASDVYPEISDCFYCMVFGYFSVKHLPVTLLAPINASGPVWTMLGAMVIYGERLNALQWTGVAISLGFYYVLSFSGNIHGPDGKDKKWIFFAFLSILFNSISALLDKYLVRQYDRIAMQAWFSVYTALIFFVLLMIIWYPNRESTSPFIWRWSVPLIGIVLVIADFLYFKALAYDRSLVSILIIIRRASAVIVFAAGAFYFKETSLRRRGIVLAGILIGVALVVAGSL
jgi:transporter family protein